METVLTDHACAVLDDALRPLLPVLYDPGVQEIMVNGADDVWIERDGRLYAYSARLPAAGLRVLIRLLASLGMRDVGSSGAGLILDTHRGPWRIAAVMHPVATRGDALCIRKHGTQWRSLADLMEPSGDHPDDLRTPVPASSHDASVDPGGIAVGPLHAYLRSVVLGRRNLVVSGGTSSGKTTLLGALLGEIPAQDRVVVIEDTPELRISTANHVRFEANPQWAVDLRQLLRAALRFRPDRLVVGEVRGAEAFDLLQALSTGHPGSLATVHADDAHGALGRIEQLVLQSGIPWPYEALRRQIARSIQVVVQVGRCAGRRGVTEVIELEGYSDGAYRTRQIFPPHAGAPGPLGAAVACSRPVFPDSAGRPRPGSSHALGGAPVCRGQQPEGPGGGDPVGGGHHHDRDHVHVR